MKKIVRTVCIGALSGMAFLAACCTTKGGLSKSERKQLIKERDSIQQILRMREMASVYGSPEVMGQYSLETMRLQSQLDSINFKLGEEVDLEKGARKIELQERLNAVRAELMRREGACVYGSPEIIEEYGRETQRLRQEAEEIMQEIKALDEHEVDTITQEEIEALPSRKAEGRAADVLYGSPDPNR